MAEYTPNYALYKPNREDRAIEVDKSLADNFEKIDVALKGNSDRIGNTSQIKQQTDFVNLIKNRIGYNRFRLRKLNETQPEVVFDDGNKHVTYRFNKDSNDDFYKLNKVYAGDVGDLVISEKDIQAGDITGTWNATSMASTNWYTTQVGSTFTGTVTGTTLKFTSYNDDRGGIWEFVVDGDTTNKVILSTWNSVAASSVQQTIKSGLANTSHTVVATFKGDDPAHVPSTGSGTARGWAYVNTSLTGFGTILGCIKASNPESKRLLIDGSNKEFAFSVTYNGVTAWIPEHSGVGTAFQIDPIRYLVDNVEKDISVLPNNTYIDFTSNLAIKQHFYARVSGVDIAEVWITHFFNRDGSVKWSGKIKVLQPFRMNFGYPLMLPIANETFTEVTTGLYNSRVSDFSGSVFNFNDESDEIVSCVSVDSVNKDYIVACKVENPIKTMRQKESTGKPTTTKPLYLSQRTDFPKIYYVSHESKDMIINETYTWSGEIAAAQIKEVYTLIK